MPSFCAVDKCNDKYGHDPSISFHKFPIKRPDLLGKWLQFAQRGSAWRPSKWSAICSRHFRDDDFSCGKDRRTLKKTAVPSVMCSPQKEVATKPKETSDKVKETSTLQQAAAEEDSQQLEIPKRMKPPAVTSSPITSKITCRLCGNCSSAVTTFATNFEIYGMIQKCFPNLNIHKDDAMPKDMCRVCWKRLESFSRFIDQVMKTQNELQRKLRSDSQKQSNRPLNIKQEPVFRVKQEQADVFDSFLSDDMDENCEHDNEGACSPKETVDQKLDFDDFPSLNTQDIIDNCDIMEIVNLDDPFINIPDDDGNTTGLGDLLLTRKTPRPSSAHDVLQAHMLNEEHNYAYPMEDCKDDWPLKDSYKTEKIENYEFFTDVLQAKQSEQDNQFELGHSSPAELMPNLPDANGGGTVITEGYVDVPEDPKLSSKPIITSVSDLREKDAQVTAVDSFATFPKPLAKSHNKPNIVVLNESIVKSSSAFKLLACAVCQLKFVSMQSLRLHEDAMGHGSSVPMVSVPPGNLQEQDFSRNPPVESQKETLGSQGMQNGNFFKAPLPTACNSNMPSHVDVQPAMSYQNSYQLPQQHLPTCSYRKNDKKPQINILEMQQTFINNMDIFGQRFAAKQMNCPPSNDGEANKPLVEEVVFKPPVPPLPEVATPKTVSSGKRWASKRKPQRAYPSTHMNLGKLLKHHNKSPATLQTVAMKYAQLQRSYQQLQHKLNQLQACSTTSTATKFKQLLCNICHQGFSSIYKLLHHKQLLLHYVVKPHHFAGSCMGCEKFFRSKLALRNHMRYICQALSLRFVFSNPMKALKCRHCRMVTFTHWRLYRRHEINCQQRRAKQQHAKSFSRHAGGTAARSGRLACPKCSKRFPNQNALSQHVITHSQERKHVCGLCPKEFKRRNGLMQHIKGYHLNLKPYTCPVCQHDYALKCDMLRCRHSKSRKRLENGPTRDFVGEKEGPKSRYKRKK